MHHPIGRGRQGAHHLPHENARSGNVGVKGLHLLAISAAMSVLLIFAAAEGDAQQRPAGGVPRNVPPVPRDRIGDVIIVEREIIRTVEPATEAKPAVAPPAAPAAAAPEPRKPYAIGSTYSSIPSGCMKLIEGGASYYHCNGDWYRSVSSGAGAQYLAVRAP